MLNYNNMESAIQYKSSEVSPEPSEVNFGVYVYHRALLDILKENFCCTSLFADKYNPIVPASDFATIIMTLAGIPLAVNDIVFDWYTIISIGSGWAKAIAIFLLVLGWFFNLFYLAVVRQINLSFCSTFLKNSRNQILRMKNYSMANTLDGLIITLARYWQIILCRSDRWNPADDTRSISCAAAAQPNNYANGNEEASNIVRVSMDPDDFSTGTGDISSEVETGLLLSEASIEAVIGLPLLNQNKNEIELAISNSFVNVKSEPVLIFGLMTAFLAPSIIMNYYCWSYMTKVRELVDKIKTQKIQELKSETILSLHLNAFILFGLSYISKEAHNIELLTETLPQLILQIYMVLDEPFNSGKEFNESLQIPLWRTIGFFLTFITVGNAMRCSVLGKWEYYYYEHISPTESADARQLRLSKCFSYSIKSQLLNLFGHSCIISSSALIASLYFLYSVFLGMTLLLGLLTIPTCLFLIYGAGDSEESWANRYMWFFTRSFSCLDNINPMNRRSLNSFVQLALIRLAIYAVALVILIFLRPDLVILCAITFAVLVMGYWLLILESILADTSSY